MTGRRKGTPCACETDPCSCGSSKGKCIRTINNLSPDPNGDFFIEAGSGITITQTGDNSFEVSFDGTLPSNPLIYKGTVGSGGTVAVLPAADPDNIGWCYIAIEAATSPVTYEVGDVLISDGYTWQVVPSGDEIINIVTAWQTTPDDQHVPSEKLVKDSLDGKVDKLITPMIGAYVHVSTAQTEIPVSVNAIGTTLMYRNSYGRSEVKDPAADTDSDVVVNVRTLNRRLTDGSVSQIGTVNVGNDLKPIKLVGGVPTVVTNDLVDLPSAQAITGAKTVPLEATGIFSDQIASSNKVKNELDNYTPMVRTTGNKLIGGLKTFISSALAPHSAIREDGIGWRKIYIDNSGFNHHNAIIAVIPRRISFGVGIIFAGGHYTSGVTCTWLNAGTIPNDHKGDFAISYDGTQAVIWQKATGSTDVYATEIITMGWNGNINQGVSWEVSTDNTIYTVDSTGYTDGGGITHTFTQWGVSS